MAKRVTYICCHCGSGDVVLDAWAEWDLDAQEWVLRNTSTTEFCDNCAAETHLLEVELRNAA